MSAADVGNDTKAIENVRHELKKWEWQFKQANGRKPGRDDVKNDATISAKYEEYDILSGRSGKARMSKKLHGSTSDEINRGVLEERSANTVSSTPKKMLKQTTAVSVHGMDKPVEQEEQLTPACVRFALGPTPQKDGAILGLFDMLPSGTPSKGSSASLETADAVIAATPSKSTIPHSAEMGDSHTPQSSAKRYYLDAFGGTPLKRKREADASTPSTAKRQYATPAFLRRSQILPPVGENGEESAVSAAPPFMKRGLVRSLSAIIHGLRRQEEEKMDDEWDVLNEIEAEERGETTRPGAPKVLVEDNQAVEMPLGPDQGVRSDEDGDGDVDGSAIDGIGRPRKAWKKKGLKRQTRRVIMRPVLHSAKKAVEQAHLDEEQESRSENEVETQSQRGPRGEANSDQESQNAKPTKAKTKKKTAKPTDGLTPPRNDEDNPVKKGNTLAHANFRKLKIKNKNSKANGRGRKFGRR